MKDFFVKNKRLFALLLLLGFIVALSFALSQKETQGSILKLESIEINPYNQADALSLEAVEKKPYVLLEFFTLNCPYCKKSIPALNRLNAHSDISVISYISESSPKVRAYMKEEKVTYTISRASEAYFKIFNPVAVPMSFVVDTHTKEIVGKIVGEITEEKVTAFLKK